MTASGYRQVEHTADVALELWGADESAVLLVGGQAIVALLTDGAAVEEVVQRRVRLETFDAEDRLVRWMSEVLYLASVEGFLVARAELEVATDGTGVEALMWGEEGAGDKLRTEVKAVTYHDLKIQFSATQVRATVVLDV